MLFSQITYNTVGLIVLFCSLLSSAVFGQCYSRESHITVEVPTIAEQLQKRGIDTTNIDLVYNALRNEILLKSQYAALFLAEQGEHEAIDLIKQKYKKEKKFTRGALRYLKALDILKYDSTENLLLSFADTLYQQITEGKATRTEFYVYHDVSTMLMNFGNYSQFPRVTEYIKSDKNNPRKVTFLNLLASFFDVDKFRNEVISTLQFVLQNELNEDNLFNAVNYTCAFPDSKKLQQALAEVAVRASSFDIRWWSLVKLRGVYQDSRTLNLALKNLEMSSNPSHIRYFLSLITGTHNPRSLFLIKDLKENSSSDLVREKAADIYDDYWWLHFEPYGKAFNYSPSQTLDSLKVYSNEIASYDWLGGQGFARELINRLDNASRYLACGDSSNTAKQIANYKERLQEVYEQNPQNNSPRFVTEDGYKFLAKNAEYILTQFSGRPSNKN